MLRYAGLPDIPFRIRWKVQNQPLVEKILNAFRKSGKPTLVLMPSAHKPFGNGSNKFSEVSPDHELMQNLLAENRRDIFTVKVGRGAELYEYDGIDITLQNKTTTTDIMDLGTIADIFFCQPCYLVPIAQAYKKRLFCILSRKMLVSKNRVLNMLRPHKYKMHSWDRVFYDNERNLSTEFRKCLSA